MSYQDDHAADPSRIYFFGIRIDFDEPLLLTNAMQDLSFLANYGGTDFGAETFIASESFDPQQFADTQDGQQQDTITIGNADGVIGTRLASRTLTNRCPRVDAFRFWMDRTGTVVLVYWMTTGRLDAPTGDAMSYTFTIRPGAESPVSALPSIEMGPRCGVVTFKDEICGYVGSETACDRTPARCTALSNFPRFQGYINLPQPGEWIYPVGPEGPGFQIQEPT